MVKIVYNNCYGGFRMSDKGVELYKKLYKEKYKKRCKLADELLYDGISMKRHDPILVKTVEILGKDASGQFSELAIMEIRDMEYRIAHESGKEYIETPFNIKWTTVEPEVLLEQ